MVDPVAVIGFVYSLSKEWREVKAVVIWPLDVIENEPAWQKAQAEGHTLRWTAGRNLQRRSLEGWEPLTERDAFGRPPIFVDRNRESLVMMK